MSDTRATIEKAGVTYESTSRFTLETHYSEVRCHAMKRTVVTATLFIRDGETGEVATFTAGAEYMGKPSPRKYAAARREAKEAVGEPAHEWADAAVVGY